VVGRPSAPSFPAPKSGPAPSTADISAGSRLGKYEILKRLATGGMAEIFLARVSGLPGFHKMVVIKRILPQLATKSDFIEMFLDEARIAATLQHPNVVQMYDVGVVDGNYFIAMEYLHGEDVRSLMKQIRHNGEKLPLEHALNIIIGIASGLHYAHEKVGFDGKPLHIVHRDVTPQNLIVTYEGGVKLLDFGIAKASNRFGETRFGTLKGKVPYMSPEQCRGEPLDRRSDVFSLGIMLYELTLGKRLYKGASDFEILKQIVEGTIVTPHELDPAYNPALERIVMRALEKDREQRYQTAREMQLDLETLVREARLYVSPIALQQFMEHVFGNKIEAWREAQSQGRTLGDHLQELTPIADEEESGEVSEERAREAERAAAERAALLKQFDVEIPTTAFPSLGAEPDKGAPSAVSTSSLDALRRPQRRWLPLLCVAVGVAMLAGVASWKLRRKPLAPPKATPTVVARPATPTPPPVKSAVAPQLGIAKVRTTPAGATLYLDGKRLDGASPLTIDGIQANAEHVLLAQLDGFGDELAHFTLTPSQVLPLEVKLARLPAGKRPARPKDPAHLVARPAPVAAGAQGRSAAGEPTRLDGEGTLVLASSPWCNVRIDGVDKGPTPLSVKLPAGKHTVVLTNPEFKITRTLPVLVLPNDTIRKRLDFSQ
jgi:serine/threonine protein kinase